jgi:hypothetical protein
VGVEYLTAAGYPVRVLCIDRPNEIDQDLCVIIMDLVDGYCLHCDMDGYAWDIDPENEFVYERFPDYDLLEVRS